MDVIQAIKIGNTINLSINGVFKQVKFEKTEEANKIFAEMLKIRENPTSENMIQLKRLLNEKTRFIALSCGKLGDFEIDTVDNNIYLCGFNTPIPEKLYEIIKEYHENNFPLKSIVNFWKLLMANPDVKVRENLFDFITKHDFVLTDNGYMLVYKAVHLVDSVSDYDDTDLYEFVAKEYLKVKKWKKSPKNFNVYRTISDNSLGLIHADIVPNIEDYKYEGNLAELHASLGELSEKSEIRYTDKHTKKMDIRLGVPVREERKVCDSNQANECSNGLHVGATSYVNAFASANDPILVCLVNPMNVIAVPNYDRSKMRTCEYFPLAIASFKDKKIEIVEEAYFECDYKSHEEKQLNEMLEKVKANQQPIETAKNAVVDKRTLDELKKIIENRLIDINL